MANTTVACTNINLLKESQIPASPSQNELYAVEIPNPHCSLLDFKWTDHLLNEQSWVRADTFSWQDGTVYSNVYNHLVEDVQGKEYISETIEGHTIWYRLADDGHKIVTQASDYDGSANVNYIYEETGVAWYYILDTENKRFKLPRTKYGFTGLRDGVGNYISESLPNFKGYTGFGYGELDDRADGVFGKDSVSHTWVGGSSTNYNTHAINIDISRVSSTYQDNAPVQQRATQMYLYFYVGEYSQSAIEQTAGLNTELFNGKMDRDMSNMNPSATAKETIVGWGMPDYSTEIATGLPSQPTSSTTQSYTCPTNGWIVAYAYREIAGYTLFFKVNGETKQQYPAFTANYANLMYPVNAGDVVMFTTDNAGVTWFINFCNFISCKGG